MKLDKTDYPCPVLTLEREDFKNCSFRVHIILPKTGEPIYGNITITAQYELTSKSIKALIDAGKAEVVISVHCSGTSYSKTFILLEDEKQFAIPVNNFSGEVLISPSIVITAESEVFDDMGELNDLYFSGNKFTYRKGDYIAKAPNEVFYLDTSKKETVFSSIFTYHFQKGQEEPYASKFQKDKIVILISEETNKAWAHVIRMGNNDLYKTLNAIFAGPVLVEAIERILDAYRASDGDKGLLDYPWVQTIEKRAESLGITLSDYSGSTASLADKMLGGISLNGVNELLNAITPQEEE